MDNGNNTFAFFSLFFCFQGIFTFLTIPIHDQLTIESKLLKNGKNAFVLFPLSISLQFNTPNYKLY
jgi:hypothetical protein